MTDAVKAPPVDVAAALAKKGDPASKIASVQTRAEAMKVAKQFERMFISQMLQPMFAGISTEAPFGGGNAEDVFRPMLLDQYSDAITKGGGVGIADKVMKEILKLQGLE